MRPRAHLVVNDRETPTFQVSQFVSHDVPAFGRVPRPLHQFTDYLYRLPVGAVSKPRWRSLPCQYGYGSKRPRLVAGL